MQRSVPKTHKHHFTMAFIFRDRLCGLALNDEKEESYGFFFLFNFNT